MQGKQIILFLSLFFFLLLYTLYVSLGERVCLQSVVPGRLKLQFIPQCSHLGDRAFSHSRLLHW